MLSSLAFIPRGAAKATPDQQELSAAEMDQLIQKQAGMSLSELDGADEEEEAPTSSTAEAAMSDSDADDDNAEMEEKKDDEDDEEVIDDKEAQLLKELKMGQRRMGERVWRCMARDSQRRTPRRALVDSI